MGKIWNVDPKGEATHDQSLENLSFIYTFFFIREPKRTIHCIQLTLNILLTFSNVISKNKKLTQGNRYPSRVSP